MLVITIVRSKALLTNPLKPNSLPKKIEGDLKTIQLNQKTLIWYSISYKCLNSLNSQSVFDKDWWSTIKAVNKKKWNLNSFCLEDTFEEESFDSIYQ